MNGPITDPGAARLAFDPRDPTRRVDRRWLTACRLAEAPAGLRRTRFDAWVRRAAKFLKTLARHRGDVSHPAVRRLDRPLLTAYQVWFGPDGRLKLAVEAWLLAGLCDEAIGVRSGLPADAVEAFEALFFDTREHLRSNDRILFSAVDPAGSLSNGVPGPDVVTRLLAYRGGPHVADVVLAVLDDGPAGWLPGVATVEVDPPLAAAVKAALAVKQTPVDQKNAPTFLRLGTLVADLERRDAADRHGAVCNPLALSLDPIDPGMVVNDDRPSGVSIDHNAVVSALQFAVADVLSSTRLSNDLRAAGALSA